MFDYPQRGYIYDRNGVLMVANQPSYDVMVIPRNMRKLDTLEFCSLINLTKEKFITAIDRAKRYSPNLPSVVVSQLTKSEFAGLSEKMFKYDGFYIQKRSLRDYQVSHSANVLGYVSEVNNYTIKMNPDYQMGELIGVAGVEKQYEKVLRGKKGVKYLQKDNFNRDIGPYKNGIFDVPSYRGTDITLTIDSKLQAYGESLMVNKRGGIVALDPKNGEILGMVSLPSIDPNQRLWKYGFDQVEIKKLKSPLFNRSINGQYSPGSTIKPIVALNSIKDDLIDPYKEIYAGPFFQLSDSPRRFRDWKPEGHGMVDLNKAIVQSCDVYFYNLANNLGIKNMTLFFEKFSFGDKTGIDMPFESSGVLPSDEWKKKNIGNRWTDGDTIITGIGQGYLLTTPLQLAYATSIIANRGVISVPKLNKDKNKKKNKEVLDREEFFKNNVELDEWEIITNAMFDVVNKKNGTAFWSIRDKNNKIAGKTGTVQVYSLSQDTDERDDENIPDHLKDHSLYVAFAPKDDPQIVVATVVENVGSGSKFAAPISNKIINFYLNKIRKRY